MSVVHVRVKCPLNILVQRELNRGDRIVGMAESQYVSVYDGQQYDIEFDTLVSTPAECADKIMDWLKSGYAPQALNLMRCCKESAHFDIGPLELHDFARHEI